MSEIMIAGSTVDVNGEGYLTDATQWNNNVAEKLAADLGIVLTPKHWEVLEFLRKNHNDGKSLNIRKIGKSGIVDIKSFYKLFPGGPLKNASKISGIPKPGSCI